MLFGNSGDVSGIAPSEAQEELTKVMQDAWVAFAEDPKRGLEKYGWPRFDPSEDTLVRLGYENSPVPDFVRPSLYSGDCANITVGADG